MAGIQDFIQSAAQQLGTSEDSTRSATAGLLQFVREKASGGDFQELLGKLPGAGELVASPSGATASTPSGGGMLGGVMGAASSAMGGKGAGLDLVGLLGQSGFDLGKAGPFVSMFLNLIRDKGGADLLGRITKQIPQLKGLAG